MSERRKQLEAIFHAASELGTPGERERYLEAACQDDATLKGEVLALLNAAAAGEELLRPLEPPSPGGVEVPLQPIIEQPGTRIGRYKLLEKIGEGGMGVVHMAEQEEPVRRKVALKIIKLGMDTRQVVARFEAERQALALMDHPHIAKVLDAGATETGRPYFVMELVQGVPITRFCDENRLATEECLKLFIPVCQAIQSAHQKGIIHRDIKPSNVLVTMHNGAPHPMVIDFGVAKAIDQKLTEKTLFTNFTTMIGTPAYMSPEQAEMSKLDVDTRSDIYSLGVVLYELLTGSPPFSEERLRSVAYTEMQRIIAEEEPERPSTRLRKKSTGSATPPVTRHSSLATDLDWIVMKCLEKDRNRRYETANGLATDLNRHLSDEAVAARPPSAVYRVRKTIRRHRVAFVAGGAVAVALLGGIAATSWQAVRATRAEASAKAEAAKSRQAEQTAREEAIKATKAEQKATEQAESAQAIKQFLLENIAGGDMVEPDAASFELSLALVKRIARQMEGRFTNQPLFEEEIRRALVKGLITTRDYRSVVEQAERLLDLQRRFRPPYHSNTVSTITFLANARYQLGQREEGMRLFTDTMNAIRALNPPDTNGMLAWVGGFYGLMLVEEGRTGEALAYVKEALANARKSDPNGLAAMYWMSGLADSLDVAGQLAESERLWREALELCLHNPNFGPSHPQTLDKQFGVGRLLVRQRRTDEALSVLQPLIATYQLHYGSNYYKAVRVEAWLALALDQKGDTAAVARLYADMYPRLMKSMHHVHARYSFEEMAQFFVRERNYAQAKSAYDALRQIYEAVPPKNGSELDWFVRATAATKGWEAAAELCRGNFELFSDSLWIWLKKAWIFRYVGDEDSYRRVVEKALALSANVLSTNDQHRPIEIAALGSFPFSAEQVKQLDQMMNSLDFALPGRPTDLQRYGYRAIALMQFRLGRLDECLAALEKSPDLAGPNSYKLFIQSMCLHRMGHLTEALETFEKARANMDPRLLSESIGPGEGFLPASQLYQQVVMHREAKATLGVK